MNPHYEDGGLSLFHGPCEVLLHEFPAEHFDSVVTDPPYELGFMEKAWDSSGIAYSVDMWREAYRVLKPGGHLLAFGGSRTYHRIAAAIEDAGFEIRDSIAWLYSQGFPKSMDVAAAIDKLDAAEERRTRALTFTAWMREHLTAQQINTITGTAMGSHFVTDKEQPAIATADLFDQLRPHLPAVPDHIDQLVAERTVESKNWEAREITGQHDKPAAAQAWRAGLLGGEVAPAREKRDRAFSEEAQEWEGWGTALKPAFEPVIVARKPHKGTIAANVLLHGTGALNIDATRVGAAGGTRAAKGSRPNLRNEVYGPGMGGNPTDPDFVAGRWPTNVILDDHQAAELDRQTGVLTSGKLAAHHQRSPKDAGILGSYGSAEGERGYGDSGGASRFFPTFAMSDEDWAWELRMSGLPIFRYEPKAPGSERPEVDGIKHATVKPLDLMRWLVRLVTRPGGRVLDCYAGSGTTGEACLLEGFDCVLMEKEADHLPLILQRIRKPLVPSLFGDWDGAAS